jgi:hypothetical protein
MIEQKRKEVNIHQLQSMQSALFCFGLFFDYEAGDSIF